MQELVVAFPVGPNDSEPAERTLRDSKSFQSGIEWPILIVHEKDTPRIERVIDEARLVFKTVGELVIDKCPGVQTWPRPQNWTWQRTAKYLQGKTRSWFWWEWDAIPIAKAWLSTLFQETRAKPFAGPIVIDTFGQQYMAGVGFYPGDMTWYGGNALRVLSSPFDIVLSEIDGIVRTHQVTDLSCLITHTPFKSNTEFFSKTDIKHEVVNGSVLFHKCKDGSLVEVLGGKKRVRKPSDSVPSFTEQTSFPTGYFAFPTCGPEVCYFNPSLIRRNGKLLLFTRKTRYGRDPRTGKMFEGDGSSISVWPLRDNMSVGWPEIEIAGPCRFHGEQWEDPRVYQNDGSLFMSAATWVHGRQWKIRQSFGRVSDDLKRFEVIAEPAFGGNSPFPDSATSTEKNWIWFRHDNEWWCQYSINPTVIFNPKNNQRFTSETKRIPWPHGEVRGGTPLTLVGNELIGFFHSSTTWLHEKRRYYMGAYALSSTPPFTLVRITEKEILTGSESDFKLLASPLVIFPSGALLENAVWTVVFGVNDEACGWIKIPHNEVDAMLAQV